MMPITAFSNQARRELDLEQWLALNAYHAEDDPLLLGMPAELRAKAFDDIECSCCGARGATLVRGARSRGTGKAVAQGHFRFRTNDGLNPHHPLCDFYDEQKDNGAEYLANFASDKSALTRAIRDLVCRGIAAGHFSQADVRQMRVWFLQEKARHAMPLDVTPELLRWCVDMEAARSVRSAASLAFMPEHALLTGFDWERAAKLEWVHRNEHLFAEVDRWIYFRRQSIERPLRLVAQHAGQSVLDPSALREKYEAAWKLSSFAAHYLFDRPGEKAPAITRQHPFDWGAAGHALLAFSALLLFVSAWDLQRASALFSLLKADQPAADRLAGNLMGLNPFYDYQAWQVINSARRVAAKRTDDRPVAEQVATVRAEMQAKYHDWAAKQ